MFTGSDPEVLWSRPVMVSTASKQPESGQIVYAGSDFLHPNQFWIGCFFLHRRWAGS